MGLLSLPHINEICVVFLAVLDRVLPLRPAAPEALDARWFSESEYPHEQMWDPALNQDFRPLFARVRARRFEFIQQSAGAARVIVTSTGIDHPWTRL